MMELLAVRYFGGGFYTESTFIYKKLQETFPEDPQTCEWQGRIVINALATDNKDVQWQETDGARQPLGQVPRRQVQEVGQAQVS